MSRRVILASLPILIYRLYTLYDLGHQCNADAGNVAFGFLKSEAEGVQ
jgi:hypothetical protein